MAGRGCNYRCNHNPRMQSPIARPLLQNDTSALLLRTRWLRHWLVWSCTVILHSVVPHIAVARTAQLPQEVEAALARAKVPLDAVAVLLVDAQGKAPPRISLRAAEPLNPASVMKLVTTYAALDLLGPNFSWTTPVFVDGVVRDSTLQGSVYVQGQGDPKLVVERLLLLLRRLQGLGIKTIAGDLVVDQSAFSLPAHDPASFDGDPLRPYNAAPDALLVNFKSVVMTFVPDPGGAVARIQYEPTLAGVQMPATVPLVGGDCNDYRAGLKADFSDAMAFRFGGSYPASCGERTWGVAYADPKNYAPRALEGMWRDLGGQLTGRARLGTVPAGKSLKPAFELRSPSLAETIRDINKYSNNVMAQQVFLTLGRAPASPATFDSARATLLRWWADRLPNDVPPVLDNGSGLSRQERISAQSLASLLQSAYQSPLMPELMASLPISGVDGTLRRSSARAAAGWAHLKTGSLSQVVARAGYVHGAQGQRWVLVALVNHANANTEATRLALDVLVDWAARQR